MPPQVTLEIPPSLKPSKIPKDGDLCVHELETRLGPDPVAGMWLKRYHRGVWRALENDPRIIAALCVVAWEREMRDAGWSEEELVNTAAGKRHFHADDQAEAWRKYGETR